MNCSARGNEIYRENDAIIRKLISLRERNRTVTAHEHALIKTAAEEEEEGEKAPRKRERATEAEICRGRQISRLTMTPAACGALAEARLENSPAARVPHSPPDERAAQGIPAQPKPARAARSSVLPPPVGYFPALSGSGRWRRGTGAIEGQQWGPHRGGCRRGRGSPEEEGNGTGRNGSLAVGERRRVGRVIWGNRGEGRRESPTCTRRPRFSLSLSLYFRFPFFASGWRRRRRGRRRGHGSGVGVGSTRTDANGTASPALSPRPAPGFPPSPIVFLSFW